MTNHGCFNSYLFRIGRAESNICSHCEENVDTAVHTLLECKSWDAERNILIGKVGHINNLESLIRTMLVSKENWLAASNFAETVMQNKEIEERKRQAEENEDNLVS